MQGIIDRLAEEKADIEEAITERTREYDDITARASEILKLNAQDEDTIDGIEAATAVLGSKSKRKAFRRKK